MLRVQLERTRKVNPNIKSHRIPYSSNVSDEKKRKEKQKKKERKTFTPRENRSRVRHTSQLSCCWHWKIQLSKFFLAHVHISHARAEFSATVVFLVDQRGGEKGFGRNASVENTRSNQDKVDVKVARRSRLDKNDISVRAKCNPRARTTRAWERLYACEA